jgi:hypothetical protein
VQNVDYAALRQELLFAGQVLSLGTPPTAGEIIVDNTDTARVTVTGEWIGSSASGGYYGADYIHNNNVGQGTKSVRFTPDLPESGTYEVFARWTANANRATNVRYDVVNASGTTTAPLMNQRNTNGVWISLGSYSFAAGTSGSVLLRTDGADGYVIADAIRFVAPGALPGVAVTASVPSTQEAQQLSGVLTVYRETASSSPLTVHLTIGGTATPGGDYKSLPATVTIPAGKMFASISVDAMADSAVEGEETVTLSLAANAGYRLLSPSSATVSIMDPPYDRWKTTHFTPQELNNPQISGDLADVDTDGRNNFLEYTLGGNPRQADAGASTKVGWQNFAGGAQIRLYYPKTDETLNYEVQQSSSLAPAAWTGEGVGLELYDASMGLFYQAVPVTNSDTAKFLRLQILKP